jgi:hypothetical protein
VLYSVASLACAKATGEIGFKLVSVEDHIAGSGPVHSRIVPIGVATLSGVSCVTISMKLIIRVR